MRSISERDCAPLFTGLRIANSLSSLVSVSTSVVAATIAAFRALLLAMLGCCGDEAPAECLAGGPAIVRPTTKRRARNRLIRFDIIGLSLL